MHDFGATKDEIESALKSVKFNIITGPEDFRHSDLTSIFEQGFKIDSKLARFYDIKEMSHENVSPKHLVEVIDYLDGKLISLFVFVSGAIAMINPLFARVSEHQNFLPYLCHFLFITGADR